MDVATRVQQIEEYYFSKKLREIEQLKETKGVDVINAGIEVLICDHMRQ